MNRSAEYHTRAYRHAEGAGPAPCSSPLSSPNKQKPCGSSPEPHVVFDLWERQLPLQPQIMAFRMRMHPCIPPATSPSRTPSARRGTWSCQSRPRKKPPRLPYPKATQPPPSVPGHQGMQIHGEKHGVAPGMRERLTGYSMLQKVFVRGPMYIETLSAWMQHGWVSLQALGSNSLTASAHPTIASTTAVTSSGADTLIPRSPRCPLVAACCWRGGFRGRGLFGLVSRCM